MCENLIKWGVFLISGGMRGDKRNGEKDSSGQTYVTNSLPSNGCDDGNRKVLKLGAKVRIKWVISKDFREKV